MEYKEIKVGMKVNYLTEGGRWIEDCTVTHEPWFMDLNWVCKIDRFDRCVKCFRLYPVMITGILWPPHIEKKEVGSVRSIDIKQWERDYFCQPEREQSVIEQRDDCYGPSPLISAFKQWCLMRKKNRFYGCYDWRVH